jgi:hypothetical protein
VTLRRTFVLLVLAEEDGEVGMGLAKLPEVEAFSRRTGIKEFKTIEIKKIFEANL